MLPTSPCLDLKQTQRYTPNIDIYLAKKVTHLPAFHFKKEARKNMSSCTFYICWIIWQKVNEPLSIERVSATFWWHSFRISLIL